MKPSATLLLALLPLAACAPLTPVERAARAEAEMEQTIAVYGPACDKLGFKRDEDQWRNCVLQLSAQEKQRQRYPVTTTCFGHRNFVDCTTM